MPENDENAEGPADVPSLVRKQIRRYALIYGLVGVTCVYFGMTGKMKNPPSQFGLAALAACGALLCLIAGGLVARARWALPTALFVHVIGSVAIVISLCVALSNAPGGTTRSRVLMRHAGAIVACVTSLLFWMRTDVRAWLASDRETRSEFTEQ